MSARCSKADWTSEASLREMAKWTAAGASVDPIVRETLETLSENTWFFLDNIGERCARYNAALQNAKAHNPNNTAKREELMHAVDLPNESAFLTVRLRRFVEVASEADEKASSNEEGAKKKPDDATAHNETEDTTANDDDDDEDDDDDDDTYDAVDDIPVVFPSNTALVDEMKRLKLAGTELATVFDGICDWLQLSLPDLMIDDNDSVDIMRSILDAAQAHCEAIRSTVSFHREYLDERADLEVDVIEFPHSSSLHRQLLINDLDSWSEVERGWQTLIRCSLIIHTLIAKNMKKLVNPRMNTRVQNMYQ